MTAPDAASPRSLILGFAVQVALILLAIRLAGTADLPVQVLAATIAAIVSIVLPVLIISTLDQ